MVCGGLNPEENHQLMDSVRGGNFVLQPNTAASELGMLMLEKMQELAGVGKLVTI